MTRSHGLQTHPLYQVYKNMIRRCSDPLDRDYPDYGGRGITVCPRWSDPETGLQAFVADMSRSWAPGLQIDRVNNSGPYSPGNTRWATPKRNSRNRRSNRIVSYQGQEMTLAEACERSGVDYYRTAQRIHKGVPERLWFYPGDLRKAVQHA